jgi:hypothetical protein
MDNIVYLNIYSDCGGEDKANAHQKMAEPPETRADPELLSI